LSAALRSCLAPSAAASLLWQSFGRATKSAKVWRGKPRSGQRRKSAALSLLSGRVLLGSGRDADGRRSESQFVAVCRRVVAQARGCPTARVSAESQRAWACWRGGLVSHVAKLPGPGCGQVSAANLLGRAEKFATAQRGKWRLASPKKPHGRASVWRAWPVVSGWLNSGLASAGGRGILFSSLAKKVHNLLALLPSCLVHNPIFTPFFRPALGLRPCSGLTSALKGRASRPRWKQRDAEAGVASVCGSWPVHPPAPGACR